MSGNIVLISMFHCGNKEGVGIFDIMRVPWPRQIVLKLIQTVL